jgi:hypothetical protein
MSTRNSQTKASSYPSIADLEVVRLGEIIINKIIVSVGIRPSELADWAT